MLDRLRGEIRVRHYSLSAEVAYVDWCRRYIRFHGLRHPAEMGAVKVTAFLTHLAVKRQVSASTQNQALSALLFLYRHVLGARLPWLDEISASQAPAAAAGRAETANAQRVASGAVNQYSMAAPPQVWRRTGAS